MTQKTYNIWLIISIIGAVTCLLLCTAPPPDQVPKATNIISATFFLNIAGCLIYGAKES